MINKDLADKIIQELDEEDLARVLFYPYRARVNFSDNILPERRGQLGTVKFVWSDNKICEFLADGSGKVEITLLENLTPLSQLRWNGTWKNP